jgi:hypothetical protein
MRGGRARRPAGCRYFISLSKEDKLSTESDILCNPLTALLTSLFVLRLARIGKFSSAFARARSSMTDVHVLPTIAVVFSIPHPPSDGFIHNGSATHGSYAKSSLRQFMIIVHNYYRLIRCETLDQAENLFKRREPFGNISKEIKQILGEWRRGKYIY